MVLNESGLDITFIIFSEHLCEESAQRIIGEGLNDCIVKGGLKRIFDPDYTAGGPPGGTGVTLFMSKTAIEKKMGGRLAVRNTGKGSEFRIEV